MIVDASVIAAFLEPTDVNHLRALEWFESLDEDTVLYAPAIVLPEVASGLRRGRATAKDVLAALRIMEDEQQIALRPVTRALAQRAAELVAELGLHGCDAVYVALAEQRGEPLISLDRRQLERARGVIEAREP